MSAREKTRAALNILVPGFQAVQDVNESWPSRFPLLAKAGSALMQIVTPIFYEMNIARKADPIMHPGMFFGTLVDLFKYPMAAIITSADHQSTPLILAGLIVLNEVEQVGTAIRSRIGLNGWR